MRSIRRILLTTRELWPMFAGITLGAITITGTTLLVPFIIARAIDVVVAMVQGTGGSTTELVWLAVWILVVSLANSVLTNVTGYWGDLAAARLRVILSQRYYEKLLRLPLSYYDNELTGTIISRLNRSITAVTDFLKTFAGAFFPLVLTVASVLVITGLHSPWLALLLVVIYPLFVWLTTLTSKRWQVWEHQKNEAYDIAGGRFAEVVGQARVVKSFLAERHELERFGTLYRSTVDTTAAQSRFWHLMDTARRGSLDLVFFVIYVIIFVQTAQGVFTVGAMVLLIQLVAMAREPVASMSWLVDTSQRAIAGSREYFTVMDEPEEPLGDLEIDQVPWRDDVPAIEFSDVSFAYSDDADPVLRGISLSIAHGERVAFVGESGGGKTTLVNLIMRLYPVTSGRLRVEGIPVNSVPPRQLRARIGTVFQDASLFSGTIRDNMAYGTTATDEQLMAAARRANAAGFIAKLPKGLDTEIGERGVKLSGGQKQRISVARALLKDAPILILDEATSSLDSKAERAVQAGLEELMVGRTTLIIAHRLSTISSVDRIVTLRDGRIDEVGTPAELATSGGIYSELLALQGSTSKADRAKLARYDIIR
ncbi:MAG: ABC transporter ATP-binding protein [Arachnia propionica]|uniref:ABC transporter ATP-binding protein n=1 Tax=Arachnia propionica TaxID=1750 RepID=UPI0026FB0DDA|nr:ABC transporter ATP-binding protein [Arachnia propionica]